MLSHNMQLRAEKIVKLYRSGKTLKEIGQVYGFTRERARQILVTQGLDKNDGGIHKQVRKRMEVIETAVKDGKVLSEAGKLVGYVNANSLKRSLPKSIQALLPGNWKARRIARFWSYVDKKGPDECWPWLASKWDAGFGHICERTFPASGGYAHRAAYLLSNGLIKPGMWIRHSCKRKDCCNPAHLLQVTPKEAVSHRGGKFAKS